MVVRSIWQRLGEDSHDQNPPFIGSKNSLWIEEEPSINGISSTKEEVAWLLLSDDSFSTPTFLARKQHS
jgi:hypothetical protein